MGHFAFGSLLVIEEVGAGVLDMWKGRFGVLRELELDVCWCLVEVQGRGCGR